MSPPRLVSAPFALVSAALFLGALAPNLLILAPRFLAERGCDAQQIGVVMGSFNLAALAAMPIAGRWVERIGHRPILLAGCLLSGAGAAGFDWLSEVFWHALARAIQGVGFAGVLVAGASYVVATAPAARLAQALGVSGVLTLLSQALGPVVGELVLRLGSWNWVLGAGALGGGLGGLVARALPPAARPAAAARGRRFGAVSVLCATAGAGFGFGTVFSFLADYSERAGAGDVSPFFVPYVLSAVAARLLLGHLADRIGRRATAVPTLASQGAALALLAALTSAWQLAVAGALFGLSHGLYYPALQAMVLERSPAPPARAIAGSTFSFGAGLVLSAFGLGPLAKVAGYPPIYLVASAVAFVAAALLLARRERGSVV